MPLGKSPSQQINWNLSVEQKQKAKTMNNEIVKLLYIVNFSVSTRISMKAALMILLS